MSGETNSEYTFPYMGQVFTFSTGADAALATQLMNKALGRTTDSKQLKFLLSQAPMVDFVPQLERVKASRAKYAYVHPKTIACMSRYATQANLCTPFVLFAGSPTKWIVTSLMPEDRVIYTPNPMPGYEKRLA